MKECFKCHERKQLSEFYPHKTMRDRHLNKCKECTKRDVRNRFRDPLARPHIKAQQRQYDKTKKGREIKRLKAIRYALLHPEKVRARQAARSRLAKEPCSVCGIQSPVEAHHTDYSKPLDVVWYCRPHHRLQHPDYFKVKEVR